MSSTHWVDRARSHPEDVAADASAPASVLFALAATYPQIVAQNPSWRLNLAIGDDGISSIVERPTTTPKAANPRLNGLLRLFHTPLATLLTKRLVASEDRREQALALANPALSVDDTHRVWQSLSIDWEDDTQRQPAILMLERLAAPRATIFPQRGEAYDQLYEHVPRENTIDEYVESTSPSLTKKWMRYGFGSDALHAKWIDAFFTTPPRSTSMRLWKNLSAKNAERLAQHLLDTTYENADLHQGRLGRARTTLSAHHEDRAYEAAFTLSETPTTPPHVLRILYRIVLDEPFWLLLSGNKMSTVALRRNLAQHLLTPHDVLHDLAREQAFRIPLLLNPHAPEPLKRELVASSPKGRESWVPPEIAPGPYAQQVLEEGRPTHTATQVARALLNPNITHPASLDTYDPDVRQALAKMPDLPRRLAIRLAHDSDYGTRNLLASTTLVHDAHEILQHDPEAGIRTSLARNPAVGLPILSVLYQDEDPGVSTEAYPPLAAYLPNG